MEKDTTYARPRILRNLLKSHGLTPEDEISWAYYGYGILERSGSCKIKDIPARIRSSKCFKLSDGVYCVDGAL